MKKEAPLLIIFNLLKSDLKGKTSLREKNYREKSTLGKSQSENSICSQWAYSSHVTVRIQLFTLVSSFNVFVAMQTTINKWKSKGNISLKTRVWFDYHVIRSQKPISLNKEKVDMQFYSLWFFHWRRKEAVNVKVTIVSNTNLQKFQCSEKILKEKTNCFFNKRSE